MSASLLSSIKQNESKRRSAMGLFKSNRARSKDRTANPSLTTAPHSAVASHYNPEPHHASPVSSRPLSDNTVTPAISNPSSTTSIANPPSTNPTSYDRSTVPDRHDEVAKHSDTEHTHVTPDSSGTTTVTTTTTTTTSMSKTVSCDIIC